MPVAAARDVWSGLLFGRFCASAGMLPSPLIFSGCRSRPSLPPCRLSEPAMEVVKRPEAVSYSCSPSFGRADRRGVGGRRDSARGGKEASRRQRPGEPLSVAWAAGRSHRRAARCPQATGGLVLAVVGGWGAVGGRGAEGEFVVVGRLQAENGGERGCEAVSGRQEGQPSHRSRFSAAFGWKGRPLTFPNAGATTYHVRNELARLAQAAAWRVRTI